MYVILVSKIFRFRGLSKMKSPGGGGSTKLVTNGDIGGRGSRRGGDVTK